MKFQVQILGSGGATPTVSRGTTSQHINIQEEHLLIDCGEGTQRQFRKFKVGFQKIKYIFISHLHGDHFFGLVGLLSTMHLLGRESKLQIFGPPELESILKMQLDLSNSSLSFIWEFIPLNFGEHELILQTNKFSVYTLPLKHKIPCNGFLIKENEKPRKIIGELTKEFRVPHYLMNDLKAGKDIELEGKVYKNAFFTKSPAKSYSYAYCSDTAYNPKLVSYLKNVDLLYHETTFLEDAKDRALKTLHSTAKEAAMIAQDSKVGKLLMGHFSARYKNENEVFENEAKTVFDRAVAVNDGDIFSMY